MTRKGKKYLSFEGVFSVLLTISLVAFILGMLVIDIYESYTRRIETRHHIKTLNGAYHD